MHMWCDDMWQYNWETWRNQVHTWSIGWWGYLMDCRRVISNRWTVLVWLHILVWLVSFFVHLVNLASSFVVLQEWKFACLYSSFFRCCLQLVEFSMKILLLFHILCFLHLFKLIDLRCVLHMPTTIIMNLTCYRILYMMCCVQAWDSSHKPIP